MCLGVRYITTISSFSGPTGKISKISSMGRIPSRPVQGVSPNRSNSSAQMIRLLGFVFQRSDRYPKSRFFYIPLMTSNDHGLDLVRDLMSKIGGIKTGPRPVLKCFLSPGFGFIGSTLKKKYCVDVDAQPVQRAAFESF